MKVAERLLELAVMGRMALYTDIDGTISPIAATPLSDEARKAVEVLRAQDADHDPRAELFAQARL